MHITGSGSAFVTRRFGSKFSTHTILLTIFKARAGFMRSRVGAGIDVWLWARRIGLSVEGIGLTSSEPELNTEVAIRFFRYGQLLLGAENLTGEPRWTTGFRFFNREW